MSERPGFMMYHDTFHALEELDDASFKRVLCSICRYSEDGEISTELNAAERAIFGMFRGKLDADWKRYQRRVDAGTKGGIKSGEARRTIAKQNEALRSKMKHCEANEPTITVPVNVTPTITPTITTRNTTYSSPQTPQELGEERLDIPTLEEVREYVRAAGLEVNPEAFVAANEANGWRDGRGMPIRNWKLWIQGTLIGRTQRKEDRYEADAEPDRTGQRDEYGGLYL